jgi:HSP20 family protein
MARSRWQSFNPMWNQLHHLQTEVNHLFDRWGDDSRRMLGLAGAYPLVNVWEDPEAAYVEAELPGLDLSALEIYVTAGNQLTIKGERKPKVPEKGVVHREERTYGAFARTLTLPFPVDPDKVDARFENGVLLIKLPKHESSRPRKINVKAD